MAARIVLLALFLLPAPVWAQGTVTKADLRRQDPAVTERQMKDQLWSIFQPVDERRKDKPAPRRPLANTWFTSKSYAVQSPGLCRIDVVILRFAPVKSGGSSGAQTPVRAYGLDASSSYHFAAPPRDWDSNTAVPRSPWDKQCAGLDLGKHSFFGAPDDSVAVDGYYAMIVAKQAVAEGKIKPDCGAGNVFDKRRCEQGVAGFAAGQVTDVERCARETYGFCFTITDSDDVEMQVMLDGGHIVASVKLEELIVMRHDLID